MDHILKMLHSQDMLLGYFLIVEKVVFHTFQSILSKQQKKLGGGGGKKLRKLFRKKYFEILFLSADDFLYGFRECFEAFYSTMDHSLKMLSFLNKNRFHMGASPVVTYGNTWGARAPQTPPVYSSGNINV